MKFRRRHLRQLERLIRARVVPFALAVLIVFLGTNAFLESASMFTMVHHHGLSECTGKSDSQNPSDKNHVHEHCQFCFAPALASGVPNKFYLSRLSVSQTLKLELQHQLNHNLFQFQLAAPRAPPVQTFLV